MPRARGPGADSDGCNDCTSRRWRARRSGPFIPIAMKILKIPKIIFAHEKTRRNTYEGYDGSTQQRGYVGCIGYAGWRGLCDS